MRFQLPLLLLALETSLVAADTAQADGNQVVNTQGDAASSAVIQTGTDSSQADATQMVSAAGASPTTSAAADDGSDGSESVVVGTLLPTDPVAATSQDISSAASATPDASTQSDASASTQAAAAPADDSSAADDSSPADDSPAADAPADYRTSGPQIYACINVDTAPTEKYQVTFSATSQFTCAPQPSNGTSVAITQAGSTCASIGTMTPTGGACAFPATLSVKWQAGNSGGQSGSMNAHWQPQNDGTGNFVWIGDDVNLDSSVCGDSNPCARDEAWPDTNQSVYLIFKETVSSAGIESSVSKRGLKVAGIKLFK